MSDEIEKLRAELAEANARRADLRTALEWACEERDRLRRELAEAREQRDELERWKGEHQFSIGLSMALEQRDEARAEVERLRAEVHARTQRITEVGVMVATNGNALAKDAYRRGAETMREACEACVANLSHEDGLGMGSQRIEGALRALPIPEDR